MEPACSTFAKDLRGHSERLAQRTSSGGAALIECHQKRTQDLPMLMPDQTQSKQRMPRRFGFLRVPLFRLLAINLAAGIAVAALLVGGLLVLNPGGLRGLIFADNSPGTALGLLLFGFVVTFGSAAMGTAIMAMGKPKADNDNQRGPPRLVAQASTRRAPR